MRKFMTVMLLAVSLAACGDAEQAATTTFPPETTVLTTSTSTTVPTTTSTTVPTTTSTTTGPTTTTQLETTTTATPTTLPGEEIEFGPGEGDSVAVIGVAHDDVLNLRAGPGVEFDIVAEIPPLDEDLLALGEARDIGQAFWMAVEHEGTEGWVNFRYIAHLGVTDDETAAVVDQLGDRPTAGTMEELGMIVAGTLASEEPPSDIVQVSESRAGDLGEVTYDVVGLGDDAVAGLRVHVFGEPVDEGFSLRTVEVTTLCGRGVTDEGLCQ